MTGMQRGSWKNLRQGLLWQEEDRQRMQEPESVAVEVTDLQQQSGVCVASLAAHSEDRCLLPLLKKRAQGQGLGSGSAGLPRDPAPLPRQSDAIAAETPQ